MKFFFTHTKDMCKHVKIDTFTASHYNYLKNNCIKSIFLYLVIYHLKIKKHLSKNKCIEIISYLFIYESIIIESKQFICLLIFGSSRFNDEWKKRTKVTYLSHEPFDNSMKKCSFVVKRLLCSLPNPLFTYIEDKGTAIDSYWSVTEPGNVIGKTYLPKVYHLTFS